MKVETKLYLLPIDPYWYLLPVFHDSKTVFGNAKFHREVGHLSQYVCQLPNPPLKLICFFLNISRTYETYKTLRLSKVRFQLIHFKTNLKNTFNKHSLFYCFRYFALIGINRYLYHIKIRCLRACMCVCMSAHFPLSSVQLRKKISKLLIMPLMADPTGEGGGINWI